MDGERTAMALSGIPGSARRSIQGASESADARRQAQAHRAAEEFEAMFLSQMLAPIFENLQSDGPFGGGPGERIYRSLMVQEYGKALAANGGVGIAEAVQREILKLQEIE